MINLNTVLPLWMELLQTFWLPTSFLLISVLSLVFVYDYPFVIGQFFSGPNLPFYVPFPSYDQQPYSIHRHRFEALKMIYYT